MEGQIYPEEGEGMVCVDFPEEPEISADDQKVLWGRLIAERQNKETMGELDDIDPDNLTPLEWQVLNRVLNPDMGTIDITAIAEVELEKFNRAYELKPGDVPKPEKYTEPYKSRSNFYALMLQMVMKKQTQERLNKLLKKGKMAA
jgi:hypothetical protein